MAIPNVVQVALKITGIAQAQTIARQFNRTIKGMGQQTSDLAKEINRAAKGMADSFSQFATRVNLPKDKMDQLRSAALRLSRVWQQLGETVIHIPSFEKAIRLGFDMEDSFRFAVEEGQRLDSTFTLLGFSASQIATGIGVVTAAIGAMATAWKIAIKVMDQSVDVFKEIVGQSNLLRLELGLTLEQASGLRLAALETNTSFTTLSTTIAQFDRRLVDLRLRFAQGEDINNAFTRSLTALGFSVEDLATTTRPTIQIFEEINDALREVTPSSEAAGLAAGIYGRSVRGILPFIEDAVGGTEEFTKRARELGVVVTEVDRIALREFLKTSADLFASISGLALVIARDIVPAITLYAGGLTKLITKLRSVIILTIAAIDATVTYVFTLGNTEQAIGTLTRTINRLNAILDDATKENLALADAQRDLAISAINARLEEQALADELQDTLGKLADLREELGSKLLEIQIRNDQQIEDAFLRHWRRIVDIERRWDQKLADARTKFDRAREDAFIRESQRLRDMIDDRQRRISNLEEDFRFKREDLERKHRDKLEDIQTKFRDTVQEAARSNDAVAVVRAIRQRARDIRDAETKRGRGIRDLDIDLARRRKRINDDAKAREDAQKKRLQDELDRARLQYERQLEDLRESLRRQREEAGISYRRRLDDIEISFRRQQATAARWYIRQENELLRHFTNMTRISAQELMRMGLTMEQVIRIVVFRVTQAAQEAARRAAASSIRGGGGGGVGGGTAPGGPRWTPRAEGGIDIVRRPTTFLAGEAGPEIAAFIPLRGSMNISHSFGKLGVDINGAGGMNTGQVESIVYAAMIRLAQRLESKVVR